MKRFFIALAAIGLLAAMPPAVASTPSPSAGPATQGPHAVSATQGSYVIAANDRHKKRGQQGTRRRGRRGNANVNVNVNRNTNVNVNRNINVNRNTNVNRNVVRGRHFNARIYRRNFRSARRFHWGVYRRPAGWYYRRWVFGERLPRAWIVRNYYITNYVMFGLIAPPPGYVWVRVGNDALLIDPETGEVLRVVYDVYY